MNPATDTATIKTGATDNSVYNANAAPSLGALSASHAAPACLRRAVSVSRNFTRGFHSELVSLTTRLPTLYLAEQHPRLTSGLDDCYSLRTVVANKGAEGSALVSSCLRDPAGAWTIARITASGTLVVFNTLRAEGEVSNSRADAATLD